jgi:glycosyltransferase involved in cell wall biosynthesis
MAQRASPYPSQKHLSPVAIHNNQNCMKIIYTLPSIATPHGGYRIVLEHLHNLQRKGHDVMLFIEQGSTLYDWYGPGEVFVTRDYRELNRSDVVVIGSPHSIDRAAQVNRSRSSAQIFTFMQMAEHIFRPSDMKFLQQCKRFYTSPFPMIHGSHWGERVCHEFGRKHDTHYVTNSVNRQHFDEYSVHGERRERNTILIEGWEASNAAKDTSHIGPKVAAKMKAKHGTKIIAYGFQPIATMKEVCDEYHYRPSLQEINKLYERATLLLKATRYDATALSPMEASVKGCPVVRSIIEGDDWLIDRDNCIRVGYTVPETTVATELMLLNDAAKYDCVEASQKFLNTFSWDTIADRLINIFTS